MEQALKESDNLRPSNPLSHLKLAERPDPDRLQSSRPG
jgi:hypothetical protein